MSDNATESIELWTCAKIIGRECATINKDYLICKKHTKDVFTCLDKSKEAMICATNILEEVKTKFPIEFNIFKKCLDKNDYRYEDCRKEEHNLYECWNKLKMKTPP